jgi:hypothetical protein
MLCASGTNPSISVDPVHAELVTRTTDTDQLPGGPPDYDGPKYSNYILVMGTFRGAAPAVTAGRIGPH